MPNSEHPSILARLGGVGRSYHAHAVRELFYRLLQVPAGGAIAGKGDAIIADVGGQWSDLKGGFTEKVLQGTQPVLFRPLIGPRRRFCDEPITRGEP